MGKKLLIMGFVGIFLLAGLGASNFIWFSPEWNVQANVDKFLATLSIDERHQPPEDSLTVKNGELQGIQSGKPTLDLHVGQSSQEVIAVLGEPERKDPSVLGYEWWMYNEVPANYIQIGIMDDQIVDLYVASESHSIKGVELGTAEVVLKHHFPFEPVVSFNYDGAAFDVTNELNERPLVLIDEAPTVFYLDHHNENRVAGIRMFTKEWFVKSKLYGLRWTYDRNSPDVNTLKEWTPRQQTNIQLAVEQRILDLSNAARTQHALNGLSWNEQAAEVAREHSQDMRDHDYFDHVSETSGKDPFERMRAHDLRFRIAGENIAMGYLDAIETHHGWMNSLGHRENILNPSFTTLGVGVIDTYSTQNFVTP